MQMFDMSRFITSGRLARPAGTLVLLIGVGAGIFKLVAQAPPAAADGGPSSSLAQSVRPFLERNCIGCHNTGMPSGQVDMQKLLASTTSLLDDRDTWENIAFRMRSDRKVYQSLPSTFDNLAPRLQSAQNGSSCPRISVNRKSGMDRHLD